MTKRIPLLALGVLFLAALGWGVRWWTHPHLLDDTSPIQNTIYPTTPVALATAYAGVAVGPRSDEIVELHRVTAHFRTNSAHARATFSLCQTRAGQSALGSAINQPLSGFCSSVTPVRDGTQFHFSTGSAGARGYIVMTLTPSTPGTASVDRIDFNYSRSWQHLHQRGSESSAQQYTVHASA